MFAKNNNNKMHRHHDVARDNIQTLNNRITWFQSRGDKKLYSFIEKHQRVTDPYDSRGSRLDLRNIHLSRKPYAH